MCGQTTAAYFYVDMSTTRLDSEVLVTDVVTVLKLEEPRLAHEMLWRSAA